jgi:adenosylcobinamide-phosphate guanylyltransferase
VTSPSTSNTEKKCLRENLKIIRTDGRGYHIDLKQAILAGGFGGPVLILPSDAPALTGQALDRVVMAHEKEGKKALAVFVPIEKREELGLSVSSIDEFQGKPYAVSGINIINVKEIGGEGKIETAALVTDDVEFLLNINTPTDLDIAERIMKRKMGEK